VGGRRFPRSFFARSALEVAPELLGHRLVRRTTDGRRLEARIVEVEAYEPDDPASHAFRGPSARNASMFGRPGSLYVYLIYGLHHCINVVTGPTGVGSAVLLRAASPLRGLVGPEVCRGPGKLAQALEVDRSLDGADLVTGSLVWLLRDDLDPIEIAVGPRVGITAGAERPWRFWIDGDPSVSRPTSARSPR
jgi:DNA-3-methyladenine glycosylase